MFIWNRIINYFKYKKIRVYKDVEYRLVNRKDYDMFNKKLIDTDFELCVRVDMKNYYIDTCNNCAINQLRLKSCVDAKMLYTGYFDDDTYTRENFDKFNSCGAGMFWLFKGKIYD